MLKVLVALVLVCLFVEYVDLGALVGSFANLTIQTIGLASVLFFVSCAIAATKWRLLWSKASWWDMLMANFASQFYSLLLPGQLAGEVVKSYRVGRRFSDTTGVAASVLVDRVTGLVGLLVLACVGLLFSDNLSARKVGLPLLALTGTVLCALYMIALPAVYRAVVSILSWIGDRIHWLNRPSQKMVDFVAAWSALVSKPAISVVAIGLGVGYQVSAVWINMVIANDLGIDVRFSDWCWVLGLVSVAVLLPITVAGIGVREGAYAGSLTLLGVPVEKAVALSVVAFGITLLGALVGAVVELASSFTETRRE